jgi:hypothetical protein
MKRHLLPIQRGFLCLFDFCSISVLTEITRRYGDLSELNLDDYPSDEEEEQGKETHDNNETFLDPETLQLVSMAQEASQAKLKLFRQSNSVPLDIPAKVGNILAKAFNYTDVDRLNNTLSEFCLPDCIVRLHLYSLQKPRRKKNCKDDFGNFVTSTYTMPTYLEFCRSYYEVVPDSVIAVGNHRSCYEKDTSVYVSSFEGQGTIIVKDSKIADVDKEGNVIAIQRKDPTKFLEASKEGYCKPYTVSGSLVSYWNKDAMIYCIEMYYEFIS